MRAQQLFISRLAILLFCSLCLFSCTQPKHLVKNVYAYYSERIPGTVQTDENGNPLPVKPDTVIVVYVETTTASISWDTAWKDNILYKIVPQLFDSTFYEAGVEKESRKNVLITASPSHFLYQLYLQPLKNHQLPPKPIDMNQILLKARYKNKVFLKKTGKIIELETYPSV